VSRRPNYAELMVGKFLHINDTQDGYVGISPVGSFPANGYGLHDLGRNVWNWCGDLYRTDTYSSRINSSLVCCDPRGPKNLEGESVIVGDPSTPTVPRTERRVIKGGCSFLRNPSYCERYRPSVRLWTPPDKGSSHVGFR